MEQYILRFYCAVVIALSTCTTTFAQFYDNDDEIHFYQCTLLNGKVNEASTRNNSWEVFWINASDCKSAHNGVLPKLNGTKKCNCNKGAFGMIGTRNWG